jgi:hypothetical protein
MTKATRGDQEFLSEMIDSLGISLDRIDLHALKATSEEAHYWQLAQSWLESARRLKQAAEGQDQATDVYLTLPRFPLTGAQLRALQSAVDQAVLAKIAEHPDPQSKVQPIVRDALAKPPLTSHARLGSSLNRVQRSSWRLAPVLGGLLLINVAEAFIFINIGSQPVLGAPITLSALTLALSLIFSGLAVGVWLVLNYHILSHVRLFHGSPRLALKIPLIAGLLQALGLLR